MQNISNLTTFCGFPYNKNGAIFALGLIITESHPLTVCAKILRRALPKSFTIDKITKTSSNYRILSLGSSHS